MSRRRHSVDQIIGKLRQYDVELGTRGRGKVSHQSDYKGNHSYRQVLSLSRTATE
jgi:hypothetical protein